MMEPLDHIYISEIEMSSKHTTWEPRLPPMLEAQKSIPSCAKKRKLDFFSLIRLRNIQN